MQTSVSNLLNPDMCTTVPQCSFTHDAIFINTAPPIASHAEKSKDYLLTPTAMVSLNWEAAVAIHF